MQGGRGVSKIACCLWHHNRHLYCFRSALFSHLSVIQRSGMRTCLEVCLGHSPLLYEFDSFLWKDPVSNLSPTGWSSVPWNLIMWDFREKGCETQEWLPHLSSSTYPGKERHPQYKVHWDFPYYFFERSTIYSIIERSIGVCPSHPHKHWPLVTCIHSVFSISPTLIGSDHHTE